MKSYKGISQNKIRLYFRVAHVTSTMLDLIFVLIVLAIIREVVMIRQHSVYLSRWFHSEERGMSINWPSLPWQRLS